MVSDLFTSEKHINIFTCEDYIFTYESSPGISLVLILHSGQKI